MSANLWEQWTPGRLRRLSTVLDRNFDEYNKAMVEALQAFAALLEAKEAGTVCWLPESACLVWRDTVQDFVAELRGDALKRKGYGKTKQAALLALEGKLKGAI